MAGRPGQIPGSRIQAARDKIIHLPSACELPVPPLPADRTWTDRERARWSELWQGPIANLWDDGHIGLVATLVVIESQILNGRFSAVMVSELRMLADSLCLSPSAMHRMGVRING